MWLQWILLTYFSAKFHQSLVSINVGIWRHLEVLQRISHTPPKQCAFRWLWGILLICFLAGFILMHCGKFPFHFFVECVLSNHIFFVLSLHLFLPDKHFVKKSSKNRQFRIDHFARLRTDICLTFVCLLFALGSHSADEKKIDENLTISSVFVWKIICCKNWRFFADPAVFEIKRIFFGNFCFILFQGVSGAFGKNTILRKAQSS